MILKLDLQKNIEINNSVQFNSTYIEKHMIELQFIWYLFRLDGVFGIFLMIPVNFR